MTATKVHDTYAVRAEDVRICCFEMCKLGRYEKMFDMRGLPAQGGTH